MLSFHSFSSIFGIFAEPGPRRRELEHPFKEIKNKVCKIDNKTELDFNYVKHAHVRTHQKTYMPKSVCEPECPGLVSFCFREGMLLHEYPIHKV
jgi:hypothetical protein